MLVQPEDLFLELRNSFHQLRLLPAPRVAPRFEQSSLSRNHFSQLRVIERARQKFDRKLRLFQPGAFRFETSLTNKKLVQAFRDDRQIHARLRRIETDESIARLHLVSIPHADLFDDAARRVLKLLHIAVDDDAPCGDHRAGELGRECPYANTSDEHRDSNQASGNMLAKRIRQRRMHASRAFLDTQSGQQRIPALCRYRSALQPANKLVGGSRKPVARWNTRRCGQ